jgi:hypothetical protein
MKLPQIIAHQWATTMGMLVEDLSMLPANRVMSITYDDLVASPQATIERLVGLLDLNWDRRLQGPLPLSKTTVSPPSPSKWRGIEHVLTEVWPIVERADARARDFLERTIQNPVPA